MNLTESVSYVISMLLALAAVVVTCVQMLFDFGIGVNLAVYALMAAALVLMYLACRKKNERPAAFDFETKHKLHLFSYLAAGGFVAEMVCCLLGIYGACENGTATFGSILILALTAVSALLSAFGFVLVGLSYANTNHDFRRLPYVMFAPLVWSMLRMAQSLTEYVSVGRDFLPALKMSALVFLMLFFYRFAFETLKSEPAAKSTLLFAGVLIPVCLPFCAAEVLALVKDFGSTGVLDFGLFFTALTVSCFAIKFRRSIINRC